MGGLTEKPKVNRDTYKSSNICIMEMPKGERRKTGCGWWWKGDSNKRKKNSLCS